MSFQHQHQFVCMLLNGTWALFRLLPSVGMVFGLASNRRLKPVPNTLLKAGLHGWDQSLKICCTHSSWLQSSRGSSVHPLPHVSLKLVKIWILQDKCATLHSAHNQETQGLIAELIHNITIYQFENTKKKCNSSKSHNPLPNPCELSLIKFSTFNIPIFQILNVLIEIKVSCQKSNPETWTLWQPV